MSAGDTSLLFKPIVVGNVQLQHRVVLAPLTRNRANAEHVHGDLAVEYYRQRASLPGTLLITEAITIAPEAGGRPHVPGIWSEEQISAWKKVGFRRISLFTAVAVTDPRLCRLRMLYTRTDPISSLSSAHTDVLPTPTIYIKRTPTFHMFRPQMCLLLAPRTPRDLSQLPASGLTSVRVS